MVVNWICCEPFNQLISLHTTGLAITNVKLLEMCAKIGYWRVILLYADILYLHRRELAEA